MIKKLNRMDKYPSAVLKMTLHAEWEVLFSLHEYLKWFPTKPSFEHVYSHQDDIPPTKPLLILAKLNIEADELATQGLKILEQKPHVPFDPDTKIQLYVNGCTITCNIKHTLREIIHLPALQKYYEIQLDWFSTTFDTVDWEIFRPVYMK